MNKTLIDEAVAAADAALHHAIDYWQDRVLKAEALLAQPEQGLVGVTYKEVWHSMNALYAGDVKQIEMGSKKLYASPQRNG